MSTNNDPEVQRRRLRITLRDFRQTRQLTQKDVARELDWSTSKLIRIETGESSISVSDLRALLAHYEINDVTQINELIETAKIAKRQTWASYRDVMSPALLQYLGYESSASRIRGFQPLLVPGLLQTEEYARAIIRSYASASFSDDDVERLVRARMERQELLSRDEPPALSFIMDEAAVRRAVGRPGVMVRQLEWLKVLNERPNIHVQVIRFDAGEYRGMIKPFTILDFPNPADDDLVHTEGGRDETVSAQDEVANYIDLFFQLEDLATPKARLNGVIDELIAHLGGPSRSKVTTG
ncbi:helix-turn-helix protein [Micromonospora sp. Llam0]|uniref:helix-turn-helix domain-containing protein n=1 Tax=Micromonospora sp. Llam0 TaxID=2485143 RepID=UPI000F46A7BF|nr:helix-turn-helix transcriptional regulator [Micromonospora sp. Llam0]ROO62380.1 helix-turn-helix protein [Micromonospora sp. Llam0]